jgi:hypothetical protein
MLMTWKIVQAERSAVNQTMTWWVDNKLIIMKLLNQFDGDFGSRKGININFLIWMAMEVLLF